VQDGAPVWESIVAYYYRGRFGTSFEHGDVRGAPMASPVLDPASAPVAQWSVDVGRRMEFCRLTGDYNPLHLTSRYAHRMKFAAAFPHPQRVAAQCLGHLAATGAPPRELDLWIKGPAFFGSAVTLRQESLADGKQDFALWVEGEERPALVGSLRSETSSIASPQK
jgi:acyl dehydratase